MLGTLVPILPAIPKVALRRAAALLALPCLLTACRTSAPEGLEPEVARELPSEPSLEDLNRRWQGARCRLAEAIEVRRDGGEGWKSSGGVLVSKGAGGDAFYFQLLVSDRQTLDDLFDGHLLRPGTAFVSEGWRFKKPDEGKGPYLELRFADRPARARVEFRGVRQFGFEGFPLSRIARIEDYCKQALFKISGPDAAEAAAPAASPGPTPAAAADVPAPPVPSPPPANPIRPEPAARAPVRARPLLEIVRVAVAPNPVPRGGDAELVVEYSVGGLAAASSVMVLERREVLKGHQPILSTEDRYERPAARFTSSKPIRFSFDAAPGSYELKVTLEAGGASVERTANFELR